MRVYVIWDVGFDGDFVHSAYIDFNEASKVCDTLNKEAEGYKYHYELRTLEVIV